MGGATFAWLSAASRGSQLPIFFAKKYYIIYFFGHFTEVIFNVAKLTTAVNIRLHGIKKLMV